MNLIRIYSVEDEEVEERFDRVDGRPEALGKSDLEVDRLAELDAPVADEEVSMRVSGACAVGTVEVTLSLMPSSSGSRASCCPRLSRCGPNTGPRTLWFYSVDSFQWVAEFLNIYKVCAACAANGRRIDEESE